MRIKAFISGCKDVSLSEQEREFFAKEKPWGLILFLRNCKSSQQIRSLIDDFRKCVNNPEAPVLIDQEGGRVQRLTPPVWHAYYPSALLGRLYELDKEKGLRASWLQARLIAHDLSALGINIDCLPVLDVPQKNADQVIGDRAYATTPQEIICLAREAIKGLMAGGVLPVMKHIPGHGRALCDSHLDLPVIDEGLDILENIDFAPFKALNNTPFAMTAHIIYQSLDPSQPATHSPHIIQKIIRGKIGFEGCLMSDDLSMIALKGSLKSRTQSAFNAGCDLVLHCNGDFEEMSEVASNTPCLEGAALQRAEKALAAINQAEPLDEREARAELASLMGHIS